MPSSTISIRRQIRSITNTRKVTKAMELVSASKMRKAVAAVLATRPYAKAAMEVLGRIGKKTSGEISHPLLEVRPVKKIAILAIGSNRGLCGGFNSLLGSAIVRKIPRNTQGVKVITLGRRIRDIVARMGYTMEADFVKQDITKKVDDVVPAVKMLIDGYTTGEYDQVLLAYTDFFSVIKQVSTVVQLLPFELSKHADSEEGIQDLKKSESSEYLFEPDPETVLAQLLPRLIEAQVFQAVLESEASEHSARMMAMKNATSAAKDLLDDLRLSYNQVRQAGITQEIAEISAGRLAVE